MERSTRTHTLSPGRERSTQFGGELTVRMLRFWFQYDARTAMLGFGTGAPLSETLKMLVHLRCISL